MHHKMCGVQTPLLFSPSLYRQNNYEIEIWDFNVLPSRKTLLPFANPSARRATPIPLPPPPPPPPPAPHFRFCTSIQSHPGAERSGHGAGAARLRPLESLEEPCLLQTPERFYKRRKRNSLNVWLGLPHFFSFLLTGRRIPDLFLLHKISWGKRNAVFRARKRNGEAQKFYCITFSQFESYKLMISWFVSWFTGAQCLFSRV